MSEKCKGAMCYIYYAWNNDEYLREDPYGDVPDSQREFVQFILYLLDYEEI